MDVMLIASMKRLHQDQGFASKQEICLLHATMFLKKYVHLKLGNGKELDMFQKVTVGIQSMII